MKLSNLFPQIKTDSSLQVNKTKKSASAQNEAVTASAGTDRVELSANSADVQKIKEVLDATPSVRTEKVQALKEQIEKGEYQVDSRKVAEKMLVSLISDNVTNE